MKINNQKVKSLALLSLIGSTSAKKGNQTGINLNSLSQMGTNFAKRGDDSNQPLLLYAGYPISLGVETRDEIVQRWRKYSTASFVVVNTNGSTCFDGNDHGGFITSSFGWPPQWMGGIGNVLLSKEVYDWNGLNSLGYFKDSPYTNYIFGNNHKDTDYTYISNTELNGNWDTKLTPYVVGDKEEFYPVTGLGSIVIGSKVCAYGAVSGYNCGNITEINVSLAITNPGNASDLLTMVGLGKVDLGINGFYGEGDLGGPVYVENNIGHQTTAQALGHITHFDNIDPNHKLLYYTPIDKALEGIGDHSIYGTSCSYALMTYNEKNAHEYDQLISQMEIPVKK